MISPIHDTTPPASLADHREKAVRRLRAGGPPPAAPCVPLYRDGCPEDAAGYTQDEYQETKRALEFRWLPVLLCWVGIPVVLIGIAMAVRFFNFSS